MKLLSSKRRWIAALALLLLVLFLLRPGVSRLKSRIITSISAGVGRPVDIGSVHVRLLPRPGFEIENLVIYDDPLFGAEPMLRSSEVTADLRIVSLLKGRLEVARLDLTEPSFNLVHRADGAWNLQALLERAAHNSLAPTGAGKSVPKPHFPYIEGSSGRINFKSGSEKRPYALISADFSLWQESEDTWGVRLKAQPFRSDMNLTDVGQIQLAGTWKRAQSFQTTPVELSLEWSKAQLGQLTKLLTGMDKGWRGNIQVDATLTGMPTDLKIASTASMDDFRRYDITSGKAVQLSARCDGEYSSLNHQFHKMVCTAPVGEGLLTLGGDLGLPGSRHYSIRLKAENVPAKAAFALIERAKKNIPEDLVADGVLKGTAEIAEDAAASPALRFHGSGEIKELVLSSAATKTEFGPVTVPFLLVDDSVKSREHFQKNRAGLVFPKGPHAEIGPVVLGTTHSAGGTLLGWLNRTNYEFSLLGDADIARTLRLARVAGISTPAANPEGTAQLNLQISGSWVGLGGDLGIGFPPPEVRGTARLRNMRVPVAGASEPLEVTAAEMQLGSDQVVVRKLNANAAGAVWTGTLEMPRGCGSPESCPIRFTLNTDELTLSRMSEWINGRQKSRPWYRVLETTKRLGQSFLGKLQAAGDVSASRFLVHGVATSNVSAKVRLDSGKLELSSLNADLLNGKHQGQWEIEFRDSSAVCSGSGDIAAVALGKMADGAHNNWVTGTASGSYEIKGPCSADLWQAGEGKFQADLRNGTLPQVLIGDDPEPLAFTKFKGEAQLSSGKFDLSSATLTSRAGSYDLSGTVTMNREIDVKMTRQPADATHSGYAVTGTLAQPRVSPLGRTEQANLKTPAAK